MPRCRTPRAARTLPSRRFEASESLVRRVSSRRSRRRDRLRQPGSRVESLGSRGSLSTGPTRLIYARNAERLVVPASNMKLLTIAAAADALGWDYRYETRLEAAGTIANGTLTGDLVVVGSGDPSIGSPDGGHAPLFLEWAEALRRAGIQRVDGRIVGDDDAFDDEGLGAGWAWDNLAAGYSAPVGALNFNENAAVARVSAATSAAGRPARVEFGPAGHGLELRDEVVTGQAGSPIDLMFVRKPGTLGAHAARLRPGRPASW